MPVGVEAGSIVFAIKSQIAGLRAGITAAKTQLAGLGGFVQRNQAQFRGLGIASTLAGGMITAAMGFAVKAAGDVEKAYADIKAVSDELKGGTEAAAEAMKRVEAVAEDLGKKTKFSTKEVAEGMKFVAMAGYDVNSMLTAMPGLVNLAAAADQDLAFAADALTNILSGFGETAKETNRFVDVMAYTAANANVNLSEMAEALKYVAPAAKDMGFSIEFTSAMLGKLGDAGIKGSMAGRNLKMAFIKWMQLESGKYTKEQTALMSKYSEALMGAGSSVGEVQLAIQEGDLTFQQFITRMREAGASTGEFSSIFGSAASTQIAILSDQSAAVTDFTERLKGATGAAEEMANIKLDTFKGQMDVLKGSVETFAASIGKILLPHLVDMMKKATEITNSLMEWTKEHKVLTGMMVKFAAVIGPLMLVGGPMMIMAPTIMNTIGAFKGLIGFLPKVAAGVVAMSKTIGLALLTPPIGIIVAIITAIGLLYLAWTRNWGGIQEKTRAVVNVITKYFIKFVNFMTQNILNPIIKGYEMFYGTILKGIGWLVEKIIGLFALLPEPILKVFGTTKEAVKTFAADVRKTMSAEWKKIPKIAEDALTWRTPEKTKKDLEDDFVEMGNTVEDWKKRSEIAFKKWVEGVDEIAEAAEETSARVKKAWEEMEEPEQKRLRAIQKMMDAGIQLGLTLEQVGVKQADAINVVAMASEGYLSMTGETMEKFKTLIMKSIKEFGPQMGEQGEELAKAFLYGTSPGGFLPTIEEGLQRYLVAIYQEEEKKILESWNTFLGEISIFTFKTYEQLTSYLEDLNTRDRAKLFEKKRDWERTYVSIAEIAKQKLKEIAGIWKSFTWSVQALVKGMFVDFVKGTSGFEESWNSLVVAIKNRFMQALAEAMLAKAGFDRMIKEMANWTELSFKEMAEKIKGFMSSLKDSLLDMAEGSKRGIEEVAGAFDKWIIKIREVTTATKEAAEETKKALRETKGELESTWGEGVMMVTAGPGIPAGSEERIKQAYWASFLRMNPNISEEDMLKWRKRILGYEEGGFVRETGLGHLEEGEYVLKSADLSNLIDILKGTSVGAGGPQVICQFMPGSKFSDIEKPEARRLMQDTFWPLIQEFEERKVK